MQKDIRSGEGNTVSSGGLVDCTRLVAFLEDGTRPVLEFIVAPDGTWFRIRHESDVNQQWRGPFK